MQNEFQSFAGSFVSAINILMAIGSGKDFLQLMIVHDLAYPTATAKLYSLQIKKTRWGVFYWAIYKFSLLISRIGIFVLG